MQVSHFSAGGDRRSVNSMRDIIVKTDVRPFFLLFILSLSVNAMAH